LLTSSPSAGTENREHPVTHDQRLVVQSRRLFQCHIVDRAAAHDTAYLGRVRLRLADTNGRDTNATQREFCVRESRKVIDDHTAMALARKEEAYKLLAAAKLRNLCATPHQAPTMQGQLNALQNNPLN
jgi:hypothetical protein